MPSELKTKWKAVELRLGPRAWFNFRTDVAASILFSFFNVMFGQFYLPMAIQQGASHLEVGIISAAPAVGLLFSPLWAAFIERTDPKPFVVLPNLLGRLLVLLPAFFGAPLVYVLTALGFQMLMGIQAPGYAALVIRMYPPENRGWLMGMTRVLMGALMIPMAFLAGRWIDVSGPRLPLAFASVTGVLSILVFSRMKARKAAPSKPGGKRFDFRAQLSLIKKNRELAVFFVATSFTGFANLLAGPLYSIMQVERLELSNTQIGLARAFYFLGLLSSYYITGRIIDRLSAKHTIAFGLAAFGIVPLCYALLGNYTAVLIGSGIQGIGDAIWDIGFLTYMFRLAPGREAVVVGLHFMLFGIRGTIGPLLGTALSGSVPLPYLLFASGVCGLIGLAAFLAYNRGTMRSHGRADAS
ncbi:MFS transporter [Paenibacillus sacheonensis]|uniref:MFS transporter n=1 Tax=Paenibacillus sacheonensis TaxID=742054 RepID=A0A7X4YNS2_9BACL|nr:MFS transporter [Paenibacillus sacheonensis]MBM7565374.1 MFS family permease [Paenibacillus sacheonensis]NBC69698.1 MFS transporter [Paenibacillus sacheonensis]